MSETLVSDMQSTEISTQSAETDDCPRISARTLRLEKFMAEMINEKIFNELPHSETAGGNNE